MNAEVGLITESIKRRPTHVHKVWEILYYGQGSGVLNTDLGEVSFKHGMFIMIPPNIVHGARSEDIYRNMCIYTEWTEMNGRREIFTCNDNCTNDGKKMIGMLVRMYYDNRNENREVIAHLLEALKAFVLLQSEQDTEGNKNVTWVKGEILENFTDCNFNLPEVILKTGYSDDHFRVLFKQSFGITAQQYLTKLRLDFAENLIKSNSRRTKVQDVAKLSGFHDPLYFSRKYRQYKGASPMEVIRRVKR